MQLFYNAGGLNKTFNTALLPNGIHYFPKILDRLFSAVYFSDLNLRIFDYLGQKFQTNANGTTKFLKISQTQHHGSNLHLVHLDLQYDRGMGPLVQFLK